MQDQSLQRYRPFFADTMNPVKMPPAAGAALLALPTTARRWLRQRCLLTGEDRLRIPVLGPWIREEGVNL